MDASCHTTCNGGRQTRVPGPTLKSPCFCAEGSPPDNVSLAANDESSLESAFQLSSQAMVVWERLKICRACLEAHKYQLLRMIETVVEFLGSTVADPVVSSALRLEMHDKKSNSDANAVRTTWTTSRGSPFSPGLVASNASLPPMALGRFTLDGQQGATLLRSIYRRILRQIASVLDELQQMEQSLHAKWEQDLGSYLIPVLQILEAIDR
ncbi:hypothetical protein NLG97_g1705 [Lecanicillium saksenae]|uniref:Uncharacterized protein n=1 Tax=Lecanicillium saksenae TaxID=468837 RepID=A0ACC1R748_9HYPO|nr:hypothetical protein NLG97_g1705 [Lecanicillium saksenae]